MKHVLSQLSAASGVPVKNLRIVELTRGQVYKFFDGSDSISAVLANDDIRAYEVPPSDTPENEVLVVMYNRFQKTYVSHYSSYYYGTGYSSSTTTYATLEGVPRLARLSKASVSVASVYSTFSRAFQFVSI